MVLAIVLYGVSLIFIKDTKLHYDMESFFSEQDQDVQFYHSFKENFENENNYLQIGISRQKGVFDRSFLAQVENVSNEIAQIKGVEKTVSPTSAKRKLKLPFGGFSNIPVIHIDQPNRYGKDNQISREAGDFYATLLSEDSKSIRVLVQISDSLSSAHGQEVLRQINEIISRKKFENTAIAGRLATQSYYLQEMRSEMLIFVSVVILIIIVALILLLRSVFFGTLTLLIVSGGIFGTFALINLTGNSVDLMVIMTPAILLIIGSSSSIHFFNDLRKGFKLNKDRSDAILYVLRNSGTPIFLNTITTAAGFAVLSIIPIAPIQKFGLFSSFGILLTFVFLVGFGSIGAFIYANKSVNLKSRKFPFRLELPTRRWVSLSLVGISISGLILLPKLKASNYFLEDLKEESELKQNLVFFEEHFDGVRPFELVLRSKSNKDLNDHEFVKQLDAFNLEMTSIFEVEYVHSPLSYIKSGNMAIKANVPKEYAIPDSPSTYQKVLRGLKKYHVFENSNVINQKSYRFSCKTRDLGSSEIAKRMDDLKKVARTKFPDLELSYTGVAYLIDKTNASLSYYLLNGIFISILISILVSFIVTRSLKLALISVIPNIIPLLAAVLILWITGSTLNIGTAMIFTIIYGIAVDDTMHFIYRYYRFLRDSEGKNVPLALSQTIEHLKRPMTNSTILLGCGFFVFTLSGFNSISTMGLVVSSALIIALLADIYLLPSLIGIKGIRFNKENQQSLVHSTPYTHKTLI